MTLEGFGRWKFNLFYKYRVRKSREASHAISLSETPYTLCQFDGHQNTHAVRMRRTNSSMTLPVGAESLPVSRTSSGLNKPMELWDWHREYCCQTRDYKAPSLKSIYNIKMSSSESKIEDLLSESEWELTDDQDSDSTVENNENIPPNQRSTQPAPVQATTVWHCIFCNNFGVCGWILTKYISNESVMNIDSIN